ncbi:Lipase 5 [Lecanora helva]
MPFLHSSSLLNTLGLDHGSDTCRNGPAKNQSTQKTLRASSSIANLIHFARNPVQITSEAVEDWYDGSTKEERSRRQAITDRKQLLYLKMRTAINYADWEIAAAELDDIEGNNQWKALLDSPDYDVALVQARLKQLDEARISCDVGRMLFLVRTALSRDLGHIGNLKMYRHTHVGTKDLIERYITSALAILDALLDVSAKAKCDGMESKYILEQVLSSRQAYGRSALLLSGGATFGMNHIGVLKALWEAKLLPRIISGASAGSIVCAVICTRTDEEIPQLLETFCEGDLAVFDEQGNEEGLLRKAARFFTHGALWDINHLTRVMKDLLGDMTFQEAYNRTRKILNICVSSASLYELPRLLNYITAPNVLIWSAVAASCSVPLIYTAAPLLAKDPKTGEAVPWNPSPQRWIDGSVDNDIPMTRLAEMFNVNHFIVSQVNPHVVPFLIKDEDAVGEEVKRSASGDPSVPTWFNTLSHLAKGEALHRMHTLVDMGIFPNTLTKVVSVLSQKYSGDITILPEISYADFPRMLSNPTKEFMQQAMLSGERATWPKISIIRNHCAIELALDDAVQKLRARVAFSPDEIELRMGACKRQTSDLKKSNTVRRTKTKRPTSQNSTASAPVPNNTSLHTHNQARSGRLTPKIRHKKSRSLCTIVPDPNISPRTSFDAPTVRPPESLPKTSQDFTSSAADETPNLTSSSSSTSFSSPTDSPSSPVGYNPKWHRSQFTSSSQPATPSEQPHSYFTTAKSPSDANRPKPQILAMTPSKSSATAATKSAEMPRYKRLFHHNRPLGQASSSSSLASNNTDQQRSERPKSSMKRNWALEIDIPSATKNLVSRGKKKKGGSEPS